jgi:hypothetical protein
MGSIWEKLIMIRHGGFARGWLRAILLVLLLVALAGCSRPKATVTGKVTYKGDPVPAGTVSFFGSRDQVASAALRPDGSYEAAGVPVGEVKVTVTTPLPGPSQEQLAKNPMVQERRQGGNMVLPSEKTVAVPTKYSLPGTSGLSLTVVEGSQPFDIPLK